MTFLSLDVPETLSVPAGPLTHDEVSDIAKAVVFAGQHIDCTADQWPCIRDRLEYCRWTWSSAPSAKADDPFQPADVVRRIAAEVARLDRVHGVPQMRGVPVRWE